MAMGAHMIPVIDPQFCQPQEAVYLIKEDLMSASGGLPLQQGAHRKMPGRSPSCVFCHYWNSLRNRSKRALERSSRCAQQGQKPHKGTLPLPTQLPLMYKAGVDCVPQSMPACAAAGASSKTLGRAPTWHVLHLLACSAFLQVLDHSTCWGGQQCSLCLLVFQFHYCKAACACIDHRRSALLQVSLLSEALGTRCMVGTAC